MSYYYDYYIGYMTKDGKINPLGIYDCFGKLHSALSISQTYASDLHDDFVPISKDEYGDKLELKNAKWLPVNMLPEGSYIKKGYFLVDDIHQYEEGNDMWDLFYEKLTPQEYIIKSDNELKFGKPQPKFDCEGNEMETYSAADYGWYMYPDYWCKEYEAHQLREAVGIYEYVTDIPKDSQIVIIETEG